MGHWTDDNRVEVDGGGAGAGDLVLDAWGIQKVSTVHSLFHGMWTYDIPPSMWHMYENGTQVYTSTDITSSGGMAKLLTTASNTVLRLESRECPRYQPNRGVLYSTALFCPDATADGVRDWGLFTTENGVFFRLKSDGKLYAVLRRGSSEVLEQEITTSGLTGFDVTKNNLYDIQFQWRSAGNYLFYIGDPATGQSKLVHTFNLLGTLAVASMENPALPIAYKATRTTENVEMHIGCADVSSENGSLEQHQYGSIHAENISVVTGSEQPVLSVHSPLQINSETNTRTVQLARVTVFCDKKAEFHVYTSRDSTALTGASFSAIGNGSYIESDTSATAFTVAKCKFVTAIPTPANTRTEVDNPLRERIRFPLVRGDYLIITCEPSANGTVDAVIEWGEQI